MKMPAKAPPASTMKVSEPYLPPKSADLPVDRPAGIIDQTYLDPPLSGDAQPTIPLLPLTSCQARLVHTPLRIVTWIWTQILMLNPCTNLPVVLMKKQTCRIRIPTSLLLILIRLCQRSSLTRNCSGIRSFMGWTHVPDMDTFSSSADDNPFQAPKQQPPGRISVKLPTDEWLCKKMDKLNITLVEGHPSRASEAGGLQKDQFVKVGKSQAKWYGLHPSSDKSADTVSFWGSESVKRNSSRIARSSGLATPAPASRSHRQDKLSRWEKSACKSIYICNQMASARYKAACKHS